MILWYAKSKAGTLHEKEPAPNHKYLIGGKIIMAKSILIKSFILLQILFLLFSVAGCNLGDSKDGGPDDMNCVEKAFAGGHHYKERGGCVRVMYGETPGNPNLGHVESQILVDGEWLWIHCEQGDIFLSSCPDVFRGDEDFVELTWTEFIKMECFH